jgi:flagellar motor switch protein FliG
MAGPETGETFTGARKAAIFLAAMGADVAAKVFKSLDEAEIETLSTELSRLPNVDEGITSSVLREFMEMALTKQYITSGGMHYALEILEKALGKNRAVEVVGRIQAAVQPVRFSAVKRADPNQLAGILRREHPQTVALILANLEPETGAGILEVLPEEIRAEVVVRMATIDKTNPEIIRQIEMVLEKQVSADFASGVAYTEGSKTVAEVLNRVDPTTQKAILEKLDEHSPTLAEQIRSLMFTFEDLINVEDRGLQRLMKDIDQKDLVLSLKAAGEEVAGKIFKNMSERTASIIKQEMEFLGPVRLKEVEEAQRRVVGVARALREAGEIIVHGQGADQVVG